MWHDPTSQGQSEREFVNCDRYLEQIFQWPDLT